MVMEILRLKRMRARSKIGTVWPLDMKGNRTTCIVRVISLDGHKNKIEATKLPYSHILTRIDRSNIHVTNHLKPKLASSENARKTTTAVGELYRKRSCDS